LKIKLIDLVTSGEIERSESVLRANPKRPQAQKQHAFNLPQAYFSPTPYKCLNSIVKAALKIWHICEHRFGPKSPGSSGFLQIQRNDGRCDHSRSLVNNSEFNYCANGGAFWTRVSPLAPAYSHVQSALCAMKSDCLSILHEVRAGSAAVCSLLCGLTQCSRHPPRYLRHADLPNK